MQFKVYLHVVPAAAAAMAMEKLVLLMTCGKILETMRVE